MKFEFVPPKKLSLRERRQIRRGLQEKLIARAAARLGRPVTSIFVDEQGKCYARLPTGEKVRFDAAEEIAWQAAVEWERTGEGDTPRLPIHGL
ncbi:MAG TPA: helix-turn-helix domain-containing protein [Sphingomicrobium sp.]|nr:helix-turn-helix domain-containing protein [Sphingomicrobium sp.]